MQGFFDRRNFPLAHENFSQGDFDWRFVFGLWTGWSLGDSTDESRVASWAYRWERLQSRVGIACQPLSGSMVDF